MSGDPTRADLDGRITDARAHLAGLLLQRITGQVPEDYATAAALCAEDAVEEGTILLAVLNAAGAPLASRDEQDDSSPAWDEDALATSQTPSGLTWTSTCHWDGQQTWPAWRWWMAHERVAPDPQRRQH